MSRPSLTLAVLCGLAALVLTAPALLAKGGVYHLTKHADGTAGAYRDSAYARGECAQCHLGHDGTAPNPFMLFAPNANGLCATSGCHGGTSTNGLYQGPAPYEASAHATRTSVVWPGGAGVDPAAPPARPAGDWGKCVNCHDPHGYDMDGTGLIPGLTISREEKLCDACHDGNPALKNVAAELAKPYRHPVETSGRHSAAEGGTAAAYAATPVDNRHAECDDCHNPHLAKADTTRTPPGASSRILGVGRVAVANAAAGTTPTYTYRPASDTTPATEYEVCFKCHSSWTAQPAGQTNLAVRFNPNNPSYHPVEAGGKNTNIDPNAFVNGWAPGSLMYCSDCHTSDNTDVRGPHGSQYRYILKGSATASSAQRLMLPTELCFDCHRYDTYADANASSTLKGYSRFNPPGFSSGHTFHVGQRQYPCYACHDSHGSTTKPHLIATGRSPGLNDYTESAGGGTCQPACHGQQTYTINYPR